jgi:hypothetical protein
MFNWFANIAKPKKEKYPTWDDIPPLNSTPPMPEVTPPKEEPAKIYYRLGLTDNNRVAFSMGYNEITMNKTGCQQMIDQLKFFQSQLEDEYDGGGGPNGGEPLPEPESVPEETGLKLVKAA